MRFSCRLCRGHTCPQGIGCNCCCAAARQAFLLIRSGFVRSPVRLCVVAVVSLPWCRWPRHVPYEGLTLALGKQAGDYRRVGPECWDQLMRLYGGGPAIYVDGPPVEDLTRYAWCMRIGCVCMPHFGAVLLIACRTVVFESGTVQMS